MTQTNTDHSPQFTEPISPTATTTEATAAPPALERQGSVSKIAHIAKNMVAQSPPKTPDTDSLNGRAVQETVVNPAVKTGKPTDVHRMEA